MVVTRTLEEARGMEFHPVTEQGVFLHDEEIFLGATSEAGRNGYQVLTPLREPGGRIVFVNRGFIPAELKDPAKRSEGQIAGTVRVQGLLRFAPAEKPALTARCSSSSEICSTRNFSRTDFRNCIESSSGSPRYFR